MRNLVLDCETRENPNDYGWDNYEKIGISVAVVWDLDTDEWYVFTGNPHIEGTKELSKLPELLNGNHIIGHNVAKFDIPLVKAVAGDFEVRKISDTWKAIYDNTGEMIALQDIVKQLGIGSKTMKGKEAPNKWREGKHNEVIEYCKNDVKLEGMLYKKIVEEGEIVFRHPRSPLMNIRVWHENGEFKAKFEDHMYDFVKKKAKERRENNGI